MSIESSDPRLTAYALGEMTDSERQAFEAELADSEQAQQEIEQIRQTVELLEQQLADVAPAELSAERRDAIKRAAGSADADARQARDEQGQTEDASDNVVELKRPPRRMLRWGLVSAAAVAAAAFLVVPYAMKSASPDAAAPAGTYAGSPASEAKGGPADMAAQAQATAAARPRTKRLGLRLNAKVKSRAGGPGYYDQRSLPKADGDEAFETESYSPINENPFIRVKVDPRSTFSIDVDTAGYSLIRRHLTSGNKPPPGAVRIEEMVNYFTYPSYAQPTGGQPFSVNTEVSAAPWSPGHRLVRIGLKGKAVSAAMNKPSNLVFLLDVSGSMNSANKLPLLKRGLKLLVDQLDNRDKVAVVVYAGASGLVLPATTGSNKEAIMAALDKLQAGGSTNGGQGIELAYKVAQDNFVQGGINRVILATDGDFNVGISNRSQLKQLIEKKAKSGVFLSVLGFGSGNYKDSTLETLADKGNGNYAYIDSIREARKVLVEQAAGTLVTIAKDVKIQVEFNPAKVQAFRLIGYENRMLAHRDFNDDKKDAGEIGAGHTVTALYELIGPGQKVPGPAPDKLKYQRPAQTSGNSNELLTVKLRYKQPAGSTSQLIEVPVADSGESFSQSSTDFRFAAAVAAFGMLLRNSPHKGAATYGEVLNIARDTLGKDQGGYRGEFVKLVAKAQKLAP